MLFFTTGFLALCVRLVLVIQTDSAIENDFIQDYQSARAWLEDENPYHAQGFASDRYQGAADIVAVDVELYNPHPPAAIVAAAPFSLRGPSTGRAVWLFLEVLFIGAGLGLVVRQLGASRVWAVTFGMAVFALPIVQDDLRWVQSNGMLLMLVLVGWTSLRRDRDVQAGIVLGVATALKLFPAFLIIPLLRMKRFRAAKWHLGTSIVVTMVGVLALGPAATVSFISQASPANFEFWRSTPGNLSIVSLPFRWLTSSPWRPWAPDLPVVAWVLMVLLLVACVIGVMRTPARLVGDPFLAALPWMVLASPIAWPHYLVLILPVVTVTIYRLGRMDARPVGVFVAAAAFMLIGNPEAFEAPWRIQEFLYLIPTVALVLLAVGEWVRPRPASALAEDVDIEIDVRDDLLEPAQA